MTTSHTPEEIKRQLEEMMSRQFPGSPGSGFAQPLGATAVPTEQKQPDGGFKFDFKPRDVKAYLDRFVIKQDEAKKVLSVALCDHYNEVKQALEGKPQSNYAKQNIILVGPTGVGKTYLVRSLADLIGVPFVKADATKFSETGYVGGDVEDLVRELVRQANGDVARAQYGIIYIDEIDKISAATGLTGRDVSGRGVQTNLLKLMEETEVPARAPNDIAGQIQAMMEMTRSSGPKQPSTINTRHILFVVSGAFDGLQKIVQKRLSEATIGFANRGDKGLKPNQILEQAQTKDFIDFGFEPEFIGRLPVRVHCHPLNQDDLFEILKNSEGSIIRQYEQSFSAYGLEVLFGDDGLKRIAEMAGNEQTGARGLMTVCERIFREFKFELPSTVVKRFFVGRALVDNPAAALKELLAEREKEERSVGRELVHEFARRFEETHEIKIRFADAAADRLVELAHEQSVSVRDLCATKFKDFHFGLKLIIQNAGARKFELDVDVVESPDKVLSQWVVASYRDNPAAAPVSTVEAEPKNG